MMKQSYQNVNSSAEDRANASLYFVASALAVFLFNLIIFNRYFPLTEGWWETYGYLMNVGLVPYKDFHIEFPLLFVIFNKWLLRYLPNSFFLYRLIGVGSQVALVLVFQLALSNFFRKNIAMVAAVFAVFLNITNPIFIAKDYHTLVDLILVSIFLIVSYIYKDWRNTDRYSISVWRLFLLGILLSLLGLVKQNIGFFVFIAYLVAFLSLPGVPVRDRVNSLLILILGLGMGFCGYLVFLISQHVDLRDIVRVFFDNDSKGSVSVVLFRFLLDKTIRRLLALSLLLGAVFLSVTYSAGEWKAKWRDFWGNAQNANYAVLVAFMVLLSLDVLTRGRLLAFAIIPMALSILFAVTFRMYVMRDIAIESGVSLLAMPLLALVYCNTNTAGLNFPGMYFVVAFSAAFAFEYVVRNSAVRPAFLAAILFLPLPFLVYKKVNTPYDWWGFKQSSVLMAKYQLPYPQTKGIYVDEMTEKTFAAISDAINRFSHTNSDVYLFPDIPIFYFLHGKVPPYKNVVQWFDVIGSKKVQEELDEFLAKPPSLVAFLDPPDFVYLGHERLLHRKVTQLKFRDAFERLVDEGKFYTYRYMLYFPRPKVIYGVNAPVRANVYVKSQRCVGKNILDISRELGNPAEFKITGILRDGVYISLSSNEKVRRGDIMSFQVDRGFLRHTIDSIGYSVGGEYYTLKIYVRSS